ncbi:MULTISPECIES: DNA polymerase I [unclassified Oceanispirochaeta]|uniref:DNA polymerase I n=1 Tax=unclassified Oceanispirochaeta TaxID=2635722 RepID=UPI000E093F8E|nr:MULTISPECIES: DNA polymerase I [unclassified Oceanispirochaeta]MBF9014724.1 DNA polymerase I [Oceanispirochaeta sp. M2]NPD70980.1 DNA polymerase I [Oceanispirochaeta sp. M1]RDG33813.1 DNA polymerase I [Oceanispirochaeta sp. M1]
MKDPLYLLDGYSLIYRSYFGFIRNPLKNPEGKNISAVFGFFRALINILNKRDTCRFVVTMDSKTKTFRHDMYPEYKATRDKSPDDLFEQIPIIEEILKLMEIPTIRVDGFEADDIMGTLAVRAREEDRPCYIITGDKDLLQFAGDGIKIMKLEKGQFIEMDRDEVFEDKGVWPEQIVDYLSLVGDTADNIPGAAGIGPKTASKLLQDYGTLDGIYEHLDKIKSKNQQQKLIDSKENAYFSKELVIIRVDVPVDMTVDEMLVKNLHSEEAARLLMKEGMQSLALELVPDLSISEDPEDERAAAEKGEYSAVLSVEDLDKWIQAVRDKGMVSLDTETDSINAMKANPVGICLSVGDEKACYIPIRAEGADCLPEDLIRSKMKELLEDEKIKIIGQNIKYDYKVLRRWGINPANLYFDTMIAAWMIDAGSPLNMDFLAERYLAYKTVHFKDVVPKGGIFSDVPLEDAVDYAAEDADVTWRLYEVLKKKLEEDNLGDLFSSLEMELVRIFADMEIRGISLNREELIEYGVELEEALTVLRTEIYDLCGKEFNINSTKQLQEVLFTDRKLQPTKKTKSGYSTDTSVLKQLAEEDPVPEKILVHRALAKLKSTYVDTLPKMVHPDSGRIHTSFVQTGTATGRISSKDPNLQNIPVKDENGRRIRRAFRPKEGSVFLSADYSQIELVVLAHLSQDSGLKEAFISGDDVHSKTAATIFKVDIAEVTPAQRRIAKTINFGVMYGMSAFRLSNELKISRGEAAGFIETYFEEYSGIKKFVDDTVAQAEIDGGVYTILGRFRPVREITSKNKMEKSAAVRVAVNTRIQGSAADIVKRAMIGIDWAIKQRNLKASVLLQVHDEIILEVPEDEVETCKFLLSKVMESAWEMDVPLRVNVEEGANWGDIH